MPGSKVITWNGIESTVVPDLIIGPIIRDPVGSVRTTLMDVPGREGAWVFPQRRGLRKFVAEMSISSESQAELNEAQETFANWVDIEGEAKLEIAQFAGVHWMAVLESVDPQTEWNGLAKFNTTWQVQPYAQANNITTEAWTSDESSSHIWAADTGLIVQPVIQITPTNGTLTEFMLISNGAETLLYAGEILSGSTVTINSIAATVTAGVNTDTELTGSYDPLQLVLQYMTGEFPILTPTTNNTIQFSRLGGTATAINISVKFRKRFRR